MVFPHEHRKSRIETSVIFPYVFGAIYFRNSLGGLKSPFWTPTKSQESQEEHELQFLRKTKIRGAGEIWDETRRVSLCMNQRSGTVFANKKKVRFRKKQHRLLELIVEAIW